jgi:hypothetical protein
LIREHPPGPHIQQLATAHGARSANGQRCCNCSD